MSRRPEVTAIIATMCEAKRAGSLRRAITNLQAQENVDLVVRLVVNGSRVDPALLSELSARQDLEIVRVDLGSYANALRVGREGVETEFFCYCDDDDELLAGAIAARVRALRADPVAAVAVSAGIIDRRGRHLLYPRHGLPIDRDPERNLFRENWLPSACACLFRTAAVTSRHIASMVPYREWTSLAFELLHDRLRFAFLPEPGYRTHDTPGSMMKEPAYLEAELGMLERMLQRVEKPPVARAIRRQIVAAYHERADWWMHTGESRLAWGAHIRSLRWPGSLRYLLFTVQLTIRSLMFKPGAPPPAPSK